MPKASRPQVGVLTLIVVLAAAVVAVWFSTRRVERVNAISAHLEHAANDLNLGKSRQAEAEWAAALRLDPNNAGIYNLIAQHDMHAGQWLAALGALARVKTLAPNTPALYSRLAACYLRLNDEQDAYRMANEQLKREPDSIAALGAAEYLAGKKGDQKRRLSLLRRMAAVARDDREILHLLEEALLSAQNYAEMKPALQRSLQLDPSDAEAYNLLGEMYLAQAADSATAGRAAAAFKRSLQINPVNAGARLGLGRADLLIGSPKDAVFQLQEAARLSPNVGQVYFQLARAYQLAGLPKQAIAAQVRFHVLEQIATDAVGLQARTAVHPRDWRYPMELGRLYLRTGETAQAIRYLRHALSLHPGDPDIEKSLSQAMKQLQRPPGPGGPTFIAAPLHG